MDQAQFEALPLHDATLSCLELLWEQGICRAYLRLWSKELGEVVSAVLEFQGVTGIEAPRKYEWGPSSSILKAKRSNEVYSIQMQSGDLISISAQGFKLEPANKSFKADA